MERRVALDEINLADCKILLRELAVAGADEATDLEAEMFEHLAYLAILAFGQRHLDPLIAPGAAFEIGVDLAIADAVDGDAEDQLFELRLADVAKGAGAIGAFDPAGREFELALEFAVVGEEPEETE